MKRLFKQHRTLVVLATVALFLLGGTLALYSWGQARPPNSLGISTTPGAGAGEQASTTGQTPGIVQTSGFQYIEIMGDCDWAFVGTCVNMRSGPSTHYKVVLRLRTGIVLKVASATTTEGGRTWYKILFDGDIRYPERVSSDWYVAANPGLVRVFEDAGDERAKQNTTTTKRIVVNLSQEMLYAYDGDALFMQSPISTGLELTPTPLGTFSVYKKTPSRYMQGPIPGVSDQYYDLPGVPWDLYFTQDGAVIHGAYWHNSFGQPWSHGCVNLAPQEAKKLYEWAGVGTPVIVQN